VTLTIIIPCFNERAGIEGLIIRLTALEALFNDRVELVFVDDGSTDDTSCIVEDLLSSKLGHGVTLVRHDTNRGLGRALKTGFERSSGQYVATIDSDCSYAPELIPAMLEVMQSEQADIITASPYHPLGKVNGIPVFRRLLSMWLSAGYRAVLPFKLFTYTSLFRIYRRDVVTAVDFASEGFLAMPEILVNAHRKGFRKIVESPATLSRREFGYSKAAIFKMIREHAFFLVRILLKR
jgi:dolichol-phosphate mannosyltransferase